jgi:hypothetical protein
MMPKRAKHENGKFAIYTVPSATSTDDAPLTDPRGNISRVEFHSDLDYIAVAAVQTGTLSLPARAAGNAVTQRHNLFAHGLGYQPLVLGEITNLGCSLLGTTLIYSPADDGLNGPTRGWFRSVQLGADATNVYLHEYALVPPTGSPGLPAQSLNWRVMVTTRNLDATTGNGNTVYHPANLYITGTRTVFGRGKFDSDRQHIQKSTFGFPVCIGKSVQVSRRNISFSVGSGPPDILIYMKINGYLKGSSLNSDYTSSFTIMKEV